MELLTFSVGLAIVGVAFLIIPLIGVALCGPFNDLLDSRLRSESYFDSAIAGYFGLMVISASLGVCYFLGWLVRLVFKF